MIEVRPLSDALGAQVVGVDLRQTFTGPMAAAIHDAWLKYQVLVFREQDITVGDQRRFVDLFGGIQISPKLENAATANRDIMYVSNAVIDGEPGKLPEGEMEFHADQCYYEIPARGAVLYGLEIPSRGGNTMFANMYRAYDTLSPELRERLGDLDVLFAYSYEKNSYHRQGSTDPLAPRFVHPAVIRHPETSRPVLFVNRLMADSLVGLPRAESDELLNALFDHSEQREMIYEHVWQAGDVVIWDNFCVLHARTDFDPMERRVLRRIAIKGQRPLALAKPEVTVRR